MNFLAEDLEIIRWNYEISAEHFEISSWTLLWNFKKT